MTNLSASLTIPHVPNRLLVGGIIGLHLFALGLWPMLLAQSLYWAGWLPFLAIVNIVHWALIHEAIHKLLLPSPSANERTGRLLSILMGTSFHVLRFGHLMHHQMNRRWHSEWVEEPDWSARLHYYCHLFFGLYVSEVLTGVLVALLPHEKAIRLARRTAFKYAPQAGVSAERFFYSRNNVRMVREDMLMVVAVYGVAAVHFGIYWPVLLGFVALRALVVSFMDNIYHYETPRDNSKAGKELLLARPYSRLMLHGNYHETHHLNPNVPWNCLPWVHDQQQRIFNGRFLSHGLRQLRGPLVPQAMTAPAYAI